MVYYQAEHPRVYEWCVGDTCVMARGVSRRYGHSAVPLTRPLFLAREDVDFRVRNCRATEGRATLHIAATALRRL